MHIDALMMHHLTSKCQSLLGKPSSSLKNDNRNLKMLSSLSVTESEERNSISSGGADEFDREQIREDDSYNESVV